jgi:hypothetical protein
LLIFFCSLLKLSRTFVLTLNVYLGGQIFIGPTIKVLIHFLLPSRRGFSLNIRAWTLDVCGPLMSMDPRRPWTLAICAWSKICGVKKILPPCSTPSRAAEFTGLSQIPVQVQGDSRRGEGRCGIRAPDCGALLGGEKLVSARCDVVWWRDVSGVWWSGGGMYATHHHAHHLVLVIPDAHLDLMYPRHPACGRRHTPCTDFQQIRQCSAHWLRARKTRSVRPSG